MGNTHSVPTTDARAAIRPVLLCDPVPAPRYGSKTTVKTGVSENSATRVKAETHSCEMYTSTAGATNNPRLMTTVTHNCWPRGHFAPPTVVTNAATRANIAKGSASLSIGGTEFAVESGKRSDRIAPKANRKQSRSRTANAALLPPIRFGPVAVTQSMRTHQRQSARGKPSDALKSHR